VRDGLTAHIAPAAALAFLLDAVPATVAGGLEHQAARALTDDGLPVDYVAGALVGHLELTQVQLVDVVTRACLALGLVVEARPARILAGAHQSDTCTDCSMAATSETIFWTSQPRSWAT